MVYLAETNPGLIRARARVFAAVKSAHTFLRNGCNETM
jgi:hypothetical protein